MILDESPSKRKFEIEEEKPKIISRSPIKFREFASVANMEASASKRPRLVANGRKVVKSEEKLATKKMVTAERKLVTTQEKVVTNQEKVVTEKATVNILGYRIHYQMSGGAFFLEKAAVFTMLKGKRVGAIATERIGDCEFVSLKSLETVLKESEIEAFFKTSLLTRIVELDALNEEVNSTNSNVVVEKHSDENGGNVTRRPHRRRNGDPRRRTVCSSVKVLGVDLGYRLEPKI